MARDIKTNREAWLTKLMGIMAKKIFKTAGYDVPANIKVTCGWPIKGGAKGVIGQCWADTASKAGMFEIFISPRLSEAMEVASTLAHEMIHATVGLKAAHKGPFVRCMHRVGLDGKPTSTVAGEEFKRDLAAVLERLGAYPHGELQPGAMALIGGGKTQGTRLLKATCKECGYTVRVTRKWLDEAGAPWCPRHKAAMDVDED